MIDADVLVVGGGPAGSSLAFALARAGVDVHVVDRARFPRPKPCAEYLSPEASRILVAMGALDAVEASGAAALAGVRVRAPNGAVIAGDFVADHGFRGFRDRGLSVRREVLDAILLDRARGAGARVTEGVRVTGLRAERRRADARCACRRSSRTARANDARGSSSAPTDCDRSSPSDSASRTRCVGRVGWRSSRTTATSTTSASMARCTSSATATSGSPTSATG